MLLGYKIIFNQISWKIYILLFSSGLMLSVTSCSMSYLINNKNNCFIICFNFVDNKTCRYCHCPNTWSTSSPYYAYHGLCITALPEETEQCKNWSGKMLYHPIMARIFETDDSRKLLTKPTGTCINFCSLLF